MCLFRNFRRFYSSQIFRAMTATPIIRPLDTGSVTFNNFCKIRDMPEVKLLSGIFSSHGHEIRIAGGAVRDLLNGDTPCDVDFATTATPDQMIEFLTPHSENIRLILTASGQEHGSITARVNDKEQFEITVLRIDRKTDGRHAEVEFIQDWMLDASRRDLTINSMFLDLKGTLYDYFNGNYHLSHGIVKFVGDPLERLKEDYLRMLRYFRFYCRYGNQESHDKDTLEAIRECVPGLDIISGERKWMELKKILSHRNCINVIPLMLQDLKIASYLGFVTKPEDLNFTDFKKVHSNVFNEQPKPLFSPITLFASTFANDDDLFSLKKNIKLSNKETQTGLFILANKDTTNISLESLKRKLALTKRPDQANMKSFVLEYLRYTNNYDILSDIQNYEIPSLPITGLDLMSFVTKKQDLNRLIEHLTQFWVDNGYTNDRDILLEEAKSFLAKSRKLSS